MPKGSQKDQQGGRFAYDGLDRVIHEKARLSVLTSLVAHPKGLVFGDLKQMCGLTDGNLSRHLHVLDEAGLVGMEKGYDHNRPQTVCRITGQRTPTLSRILEGAGTGSAGRGERCQGECRAPSGVHRLKTA